MRALVLVALAACTPDIVSGAYLCGPDGLCPEGQACNGPDNTCVAASSVEPFACAAGTQHEPDDAPADGFELPALSCVSSPVNLDGCLAAGDAQNWLKFQTPGNCNAVGVRVTVSFPVAFEPLALQLADAATGMQLATDADCKTTGVVGGETTRCLDQTLANGTSYGLAVVPAGGNDCGGACNYNRYHLTLQLVTP
ncbi:MAG: hypothetical protein ACM31C_00250 [Acidobacteriota bacterium]